MTLTRRCASSEAEDKVKDRRTHDSFSDHGPLPARALVPLRARMANWSSTHCGLMILAVIYLERFC